MKKKVLALAAVAACVSSLAFATPQTQWNQGEWQLDLGAWNPKASVDAGDWSSAFKAQNGFKEDTDTKWNFQGGLGYGLSDRWGLQYNYYGLKTDKDGHKGYKTDGDEHEVNLVYSINKNFAAFAGWNRINNDLKGIGGRNHSETNNVAQIGLIAKAQLAKNFDFYAKGALGTKKTAMWEAGLGYSITPDLDITAGYRYLNTQLSDSHEFGNKDDANISYKGFIAGLSYRFGGGKKEAPAPAPEPVYQEPEPEPVVAPAPAPKNDYYFDSIHFDFDQDQPVAADKAKMDNFVATAKANPDVQFKLTGNTDSRGTDAYNTDLSRRRVDNVAQYAENQGVPASQMITDYKSFHDPVSSNDTDQGRADNRRVDIWEHK